MVKALKQFGWLIGIWVLSAFALGLVSMSLRYWQR